MNARWIQNLSIRSKLFLSFGVLLALLIVVLLVSFYVIRAIHSDDTVILQQRLPNALGFANLRSHQNYQRVLMMETLSVQDKKEQELRLAEVQKYKELIDELTRQIDTRIRNEPDKMVQFNEYKSILDSYRQTRNEVQTYILQGDLQKARVMDAGVGIQEERYDRMRSILLSLGAQEEKEAALMVEASEGSYWNSIRLFGILATLSVIIGIWVAVALGRIISQPLTEITRVAEKIATGDFQAELSATERADEVGLLFKAFGKMVDFLSNLSQNARRVTSGDLTQTVQPVSRNDILGKTMSDMVATLRKIILDIQQATQVLAGAASEILTTTAQLATSSSETAAAVNETMTTVEELRQTSLMVNQKAGNVLENAQNTVKISQSGNKSIEESINGMNRIQEQMETVADHIIQLSEQSQAIGSIIVTVEELAFQSSILAVNASIEAAKAGDHGKGFAVVAQEVKSMSEQSKQATTQVRAILSDIQKAISSAVLATEQGSKAVETGVRQFQGAKEAIQWLTESIDTSAHMSTLIAASTKEQLLGVDQAAIAMENIRQSTLQNVSANKQAEIAARKLNELGQKLKLMVEQFRL